MSLAKKEQERYAELAALEEQPGGESTAGTSVHGEDAAGDSQSVAKAVGGRPRVGGAAAGEGESPTLRTRVTQTRKLEVELLRQQMGFKNESDVVRAALDEFVEHHLQASAQ